MLDLPHEDQPALNDVVAAIQRLAHGDGIDVIGELQILFADLLSLQYVVLNALDIGVAVLGDVGDGLYADGGIVKIIVFYVRRTAQKSQGFGEGVAAGEHIVPDLIDAFG